MFKWLVFPGVLAGGILHAYTCFIVPDGGPNGFTAGLFALSILPYLACLLVGRQNARGALMAACAMPFMLVLDAFAFNEAVSAPATSTSPLVLLVAPLFNLMVMVLGFFVGWVAYSMLRRKARGETV